MRADILSKVGPFSFTRNTRDFKTGGPVVMTIPYQLP